MICFEFEDKLVKHARNGNPWGTGALKDTPEIQGYKKIQIDRKGRSWILREDNFNLRG